LIARLRDNPNGEYIRKLCFLWEWMTASALDSDSVVRSGYVDLSPPEKYAVASRSKRNPKYRINNNALGNRAFCPVVRLDALSGTPSLAELLDRASALLDSHRDGDELHARAIRYLYLSETRSSFAMEKELPDASKEERFVQLLRRAGEKDSISEDWLVELQNATVRYPYAMEASYRLKQNWLDDYSGRITFFPPPVEDIRDLMAGWEAFANDTEKGIDPLVKTACASFGFVYLHPIMDGNGRLHRFLVHQLLAGSGLLKKEAPIPVSAIFMRKLPEYLNVLKRRMIWRSCGLFTGNHRIGIKTSQPQIIQINPYHSRLRHSSVQHIAIGKSHGAALRIVALSMLFSGLSCGYQNSFKQVLVVALSSHCYSPVEFQ